MTDKEKAFFEWYEKIEPYKDNYNLRMSFDAGYEASRVPEKELGRVAESTIMRILSKAVADGTLTKMAFDGLRYKIQAESDLRKAIAERIRVKLLPICICEECDNLRDGRLISDAMKIVLEG
jgi:hypothetical protein